MVGSENILTIRNGIPQSAQMIVEHFDLPMTPEEYIDISAKIQEEKFPLCRPLPGVERLIKHLHNHKIPIAVATSSLRSKFELKTTSCRDLFKLFDYIVCGDDPEVKKGKPSPDIFLTAQKHLGNPPSENCLVFEDAINGIEAGLAANMHVSNVLNLKSAYISTKGIWMHEVKDEITTVQNSS